MLCIQCVFSFLKKICTKFTSFFCLFILIDKNRIQLYYKDTINRIQYPISKIKLKEVTKDEGEKKLF